MAYRDMTLAELAECDGAVPGKALFICCNGVIFDATERGQDFCAFVIDANPIVWSVLHSSYGRPVAGNAVSCVVSRYTILYVIGFLPFQ